ncbi:CHAT domain-containing protein [Thermoflexibacter ruber]|uniref:CHAT domain-containing protein n=1 Tax=Thermoflexibacter ruber TaxID=1003 RepID=UPI00373FD965
MWKVDDKTTQDFMQRFYKEWLVNGKSKRNAFVEAQRQVRKEKAYPYYWGAFVMVGE